MGNRAGLRVLVGLALLNGLCGVLLWRGAPRSYGGMPLASIRLAPQRTLFVTVWPVNTGIHSYPNYPATYADQETPNAVWVHIWVQDGRQHTRTNYVSVTLAVRQYAVLPVSTCLALLACVLWLRCQPRSISGASAGGNRRLMEHGMEHSTTGRSI